MALLFALTLVVAGVQFAGHSVRAEVTDPDLIAFLAAGGAVDDVCKTGGAAHDHGDCPFCRELNPLILPDLRATVRPYVPAEPVRFARVAPSHVPADGPPRPPARAPPHA